VGSFKHMEISHVIVKLPVTVECMLIDGDSFNAEYLCTGRYDVEGVFERDGKRYLRMRHAEHKILDIVNEDYLLHGIMLPSRDSAREVHYRPVGTPGPDATVLKRCAACSAETSSTPSLPGAVEAIVQRVYVGSQTVTGSVMEWRVEYWVELRGTD
jgi:hypothetical protein